MTVGGGAPVRRAADETCMRSVGRCNTTPRLLLSVGRKNTFLASDSGLPPSRQLKEEGTTCQPLNIHADADAEARGDHNKKNLAVLCLLWKRRLQR